MARIIIIHRWDGKPSSDWYPWLRTELEKLGHNVMVPQMPNTSVPVISKWVSGLAKTIGKMDEDAFLIGHSIGCQTIMRFLQKQKGRAGGVLFVGPWIHLKRIIYDEGVEGIAMPWLKTPISFAKVKSKSKRFTAIFSHDDYYVPASDAKIFRTKLGAKTLFDGDKGHFTSADGVTKSRTILREARRMLR